MTKTPKRISVGQILDKQDSVKTYNESQEGLIYNNQDIGIRTQIEGADREILTDTQTQDISNKTISLSTLVSPSINSPQVSDGTFVDSIINNATINSASINVPVLSGGTLSLTTLESSSVNACTLSGSTINVDNNTLSNVEVDNLKSGVLLTTVVSVSINDTNLFSAKCIKDYVDQQDSVNAGSISSHIAQVTGAHAASAISLTATGSISSTNVQTGMVELQDDINLRELASNKGAVNGYCPLGADQKVPAANLPSYVDDVLEYANLAAFPVTGEANKIYIAIDTNLTYRWTGSVYAEISQSLALGETSTTAYRGDRGKTAYDHSQTTSGSHGITGSFVGTTDTQVITNKDIDGGVAANTRRITFPSDTLANLNALTRKEGTVVYATDTDKLYYDNGTVLTAVGSGSGSGDLATYAQLKSDDDTGTWSTGNNATFLGGGSIAGTFTKQNATNPLNGTYSYTLVQDAGSLNDYVASDVQAVPLRSRGVTNSTDLVYTYDGSDNDIKWVVYDVTNAAVINVTSYVKASSVGKTAQLVYDLPVTCTQVRFGAQVVVANDTKTLKFDDVQLATWTPQAVNLVETQTYALFFTSSGITYSGNFLTTPVANFSSGRGLFIKDTSVTQIRLKALKKIIMTGNVDTSVATGGHYTVIRKNGVQVQYGSVGNAVNNVSSVAFSLELIAGDYIEFENTNPNTAYAGYTVTATAISDNVLMSYQDGMATTATYTMNIGSTGTPPTKGTVLVDKATWYRDGADAVITYTLAKGAADGAAGTGLYKFPLPSGLQIDTAKISLASDMTESAVSKLGTVVGFGSHGTTMTSNATKNYRDLVYAVDATNLALMFGLYVIGPDEGFIAFGATLSGTVFTSLHGHISFTARVPIQGWSAIPPVYALPTSKDNNKTYDQSLVSVTGTNWTTSTAKFYPYRTISKVTGAPVWRMAFNITGTNSTGQNNTLTISGVSFPASNQTVSSYAHASTTAVAVAVASTSTLYGFWSASGSQVVDFSGDVELASKPTWADEWVEPGVFVGTLSGQWQYDISSYVTSSPAVSSMARAVAVVTKCDSGQYRMKFNIRYAVASGSRSSVITTIAGVTFKSGSFYDQVIHGMPDVNNLALYLSYTNPGTSSFYINHATGTTTGYIISGDVELESKPTWATNTP